MLSVIVRRSTLTIRSTIGMRKTTPGPFCGSRRPRRKTTPRSYSRRILTKSMVGFLSAFGGDGQFESVQCVHLDALAGEQLCSIAGVRVPELAVDEDEPVLADIAVLADERLRPCCHRSSAGGDALAGDERPEGGDCKADADDEAGIDPIGRWCVAEEQRQADAEAD